MSDGSQIGRIGLVLTGLLFAAWAQAGEPPGGRARSRCDFVVLESGLQVVRCDSFPAYLWGPPGTGELRIMGSFQPDLLDPADRRSLAGRLPKAIRQTRPEAPAPRDRLLVVVDAGHGGSQKGAIGTTGVEEKDIVLSVAEQTHQAFAEVEEVEVVMTRLSDEEIPLWDRVEIANQLKADLFISIHANAFTSSHLGGVETFFHSIEASDEEAKRVASAENALGGKQKTATSDALSYILQDMHSAEKLRDSSRLAHLVQDQLARVLPFDNRGVMQADFIVLRDTRMPSVLIELGFITNPREEKTLQKSEIQKKAAFAIRRGVLQFWELVKRKRVQPLQGKRGTP